MSLRTVLLGGTGSAAVDEGLTHPSREVRDATIVLRRRSRREKRFAFLVLSVCAFLVFAPLWWQVALEKTSWGKEQSAGTDVANVAGRLNPKNVVGGVAGDPLGITQAVYNPSDGTLTLTVAGSGEQRKVILPAWVSVYGWVEDTGVWTIMVTALDGAATEPVVMDPVLVGDLCVQKQLPEGTGVPNPKTGMAFVHQMVGADATPKTGECPTFNRKQIKQSK